MPSLKQLREQSGMTQRELAEATGVGRANIAAYETGRRRLTVSMRQRLMAPLRRPSQVLEARRDEIRDLIGAAGMRDARVIGSVAHGEDSPTSDLDLLVRVPDGTGMFAFAQLREDLEDLLGIPVDLVSEGGLTPRHAGVLAEAVPL